MTSINIRNLTVFNGCEESFLDTLESQSIESSYGKGKVLFVHGDKAERFYFIKSGWVKLFRETLDGAQAVIDVLPEGNIFGDTSMFEGNIYPYTAEVVEPAQIISLPLTLLQKEIERDNKLALSMLRAMALHRQQQDKELEHRSLQNAPQRIGCFLLRLAQQNNDEDEKEGITIHLPYDKVLVASRLGMQPETFSRALNKLRDKTGIRINGATVEMDNLEQLTSYSCAACSSEFPCHDLQAAE